MGPKYGYFPNDLKTTLLVKPDFQAEASDLFRDTGIKISTDGVVYLGGPIGNDQFVESTVSKKISDWIGDIINLAKVAATHPHEAYASYTHGITSKWNFLFRIIDFSEAPISNILNSLELVISTQLIPALTTTAPPGDIVRDLLSLPSSKGGIGLVNPCVISIEQHSSSKLICAPFVELILHVSSGMSVDYNDIINCISTQVAIRSRLRSDKRKYTIERAKHLREVLTPSLQHSFDLAGERGASVWLSTLPIEANGFALHKSAFRDALCLRYGWTLRDLPSRCVCGNEGTVDHLLSCPNGGFPSIRHNELRDITATLLSEVCNNVTIEPGLQPLTGESLTHASSNTAPEARLDVAANGVWGSRFERAFFDVRVFNPYASSNNRQSLPATYKRHEEDKRRQYLERVREVEHASFTPLIFSTSGGMGQCSQVLYKRIALMISEKSDTRYSITMNMIRCRLNFALLRSSLMCIRGTRSSILKPLFDTPLDLQHAESNISG